MKRIKQLPLSLILILAISLVLRLWRIEFPQAYVFDEVYYPYTAGEYLQHNPAAWEWWTTPAQGHAYAWVNPPLAQEIMAGAMFIFGTDNYWGFRLPGVLLGVVSILLVYLIAKKLFDEQVGVLAAMLFSLDGLTFTQSRTGMLDIYLLTFLLTSMLVTLHKRYLWSAIFLGMAIGTKWTGLYIFPLYLLLLYKDKQLKQLATYIFVVPLVYLTIYLPFFFSGHSWQQFIELLRQEWWYHLHLQATHDYASPWWSWPLTLYPVWYYVQYFPNNVMSNIFAAGNPLLYWFGSLSLLITTIQFFQKKAWSLLILITTVGLFWLPWSLSPRIMFLYYFIPVVPFICISLAYQLNNLLQTKYRQVAVVTVFLCIFSFACLFPFLSGLPLPNSLIKLFFSTNLAKDPFGG